MTYKKRMRSFLCALFCLATVPVWAAPDALVAPTAPAVPITIEADYLHYDEKTGFVKTVGNTKVQQGITAIYTDEMIGDVRTGDVHADGKVRWVENNSEMIGDKLDYNLKTKQGKMGPSKGNLDGYLVNGQSTDFAPDRWTTYGGTLTKCPAEDPDFKFTAKKVEIYPDDKMIAYDASFWLGHTKVFSIPKFVKSLKEKDDSSIPRIGYEEDNGFYIKQYLEYPLGDTWSAMADLRYYSKRGLENQFGLIQRDDDYKLTVIYGSDFNSDNEWFQRKPELTLTTIAKPVGNLPYTYYYRLQTGLIQESSVKEMWRTGATVYLNHNPIPLDDRTTLSLGASYEYDWYEDNGERGLLRTRVALKHKINDNLSTGISYNHAQQSGNTPFKYDRMKVANELVNSTSWKIDKLWQVGVYTSYDLDREYFRDVDYSVTRNLHCFDVKFTYREKRDQILVNFNGIYF